MTKKEFLELYAHMSCVSLLFDDCSDTIKDLNERITDCIIKSYVAPNNEEYIQLEQNDYQNAVSPIQKFKNDNADDLHAVISKINEMFNQ